MQTDFLDVFAKQLVTKPTEAESKPSPSASRAVSVSHRNATYHRPGNVRRRMSVAEIVYQCIVDCGEHGATREEIARLTGLKLSSVCGRVSELLGEPRPRVVQHGDKRPGPAPGSHSQTIVRAS